MVDLLFSDQHELPDGGEKWKEVIPKNYIDGSVEEVNYSHRFIHEGPFFELNLETSRYFLQGH